MNVHRNGYNTQKKLQAQNKLLKEVFWGKLTVKEEVENKVGIFGTIQHNLEN